MKALVYDRPDGHAAALYEWASVHDFLGSEMEAIPLYRLALDAGLDYRQRTQALIQLGCPAVRVKNRPARRKSRTSSPNAITVTPTPSAIIPAASVSPRRAKLTA